MDESVLQSVIMKKILITFGTRPEAIKMLPLLKALQLHKNEFEVKCCVTGQHRQMLQQVLDIFAVKPDYDLDIMAVNQSISDITSNILHKIGNILRIEQPDLVLVQGDTTSSFAISLAAFYQKIDVAHVEAGLRTGNLHSPWPEEGNRLLTARLAKYHFAPTVLCKQNLAKENITHGVFVTGNTVIDALLSVVRKIDLDKSLSSRLALQIKQAGYPIEINLNNPDKKFILITGHRRESFGEPFLNICQAIRKLADKHPEINFVYPVHLNPNVRTPVNSILSNAKNIFLIEPLDYLEFVFLMRHSYLLLTDSGGLQEEAPSLGKPVLVMREHTERIEGITAGTAILVGTNPEAIIENVERLINDKAAYEKMSRAHNPYGDGTACDKIVNLLLRYLAKMELIYEHI